MALFQRKNEETIGLSIEGMHCEMCAMNLRRGLLGEAGVKKAEVSFPQKRASIVYDAAKTDPSRIIRAVEEIGYDATIE